jgi:putative restriction endonuclease
LLVPPPASPEAERVERRRYFTREVQQRLHQQLFRARVIRAYAETCAICRLRRRELLEAAHIAADTDPRGEPGVPNGVAMCALHRMALR